MKISVLENPVINWPVDFDLDTEGGSVKVGFMAKFKVLPDAEIDSELAKGDSAFLDTVLVGWDEIEDEDGAQLAFTKENKDLLFSFAFRRVQAVSAYFECIGSCARKNSKRRPVTG